MYYVYLNNKDGIVPKALPSSLAKKEVIIYPSFTVPTSINPNSAQNQIKIFINIYKKH